jgi:hypothetical protein
MAIGGTPPAHKRAQHRLTSDEKRERINWILAQPGRVEIPQLQERYPDTPKTTAWRLIQAAQVEAAKGSNGSGSTDPAPNGAAAKIILFQPNRNPEKPASIGETRHHINGGTYPLTNGALPGKTHQSHQTHHAAPIVALTVIENATGPATKVLELDAHGNLVKRAAAQIHDGRSPILEVSGLRGAIETVEQLKPSEGLVYGLPTMREARIVTQEELRRGGSTGAIARDREHFGLWPGGRP